jgi:hypothetical protein
MSDARVLHHGVVIACSTTPETEVNVFPIHEEPFVQ